MERIEEFLMIKCRLAELMKEQGIKQLSIVVRGTNINRNTLEAMLRDQRVRIELPVADKLCKYFKCDMQDLFQYIPNE